LLEVFSSANGFLLFKTMAVSMSLSGKITSQHEKWRENMCMLTLQYVSIQHWPYVTVKWNNVFQNEPKLMAYRKMS
jgi:hypothetical protein